MAIGSITHGFAGYLTVEDSRILCREGASLSMPRNLDIPYPISVQRWGMLNYCDGLRFPVIQAPTIPMDMNGTGVDAWFTYDNLFHWFFERSNMPAFDLPTLSNIDFSDNGQAVTAGIGSYRLVNCKAAGFSLNVEKGSPIGFVMRFAGTDRRTTGFTSPIVGLPGQPLNFGRVSLSGPLNDIDMIGFTLDVDTGLTPNMALDGTERVVAQNADLLTATFTMRINANVGIDPPGMSLSDSVLPIYPEVLNSGIHIVRERDALDGTTITVLSFGIPRMILVDPDDRRQMRGRVVRSFRYSCLATLDAFPVNISEV